MAGADYNARLAADYKNARLAAALQHYATVTYGRYTPPRPVWERAWEIAQREEIAQRARALANAAQMGANNGRFIDPKNPEDRKLLAAAGIQCGPKLKFG